MIAGLDGDRRRGRVTWSSTEFMGGRTSPAMTFGWKTYGRSFFGIAAISSGVIGRIERAISGS
jgi:hypothetical protein